MKIAGCSDKGYKRSNNEDSFGFKVRHDGAVLALVCDGIGGNNAGDVASKIAVDSFLEDFENSPKFHDSHAASKWIKKEIQNLNDKIYRIACSKKEYFGMGTTLVGVFICDDYTLIINVGDSRAYGYFDELVCLTKDHNLMEELLESGQIKEGEVVSDSTKHVLTNALGIYNRAKVDIGLVNSDYDAILLCSDGLHGYVKESVIENVLIKDKPVEDKVELLVQAALIEGGYDNTTVVLIEKEVVL